MGDLYAMLMVEGGSPFHEFMPHSGTPYGNTSDCPGLNPGLSGRLQLSRSCLGASTDHWDRGIGAPPGGSPSLDRHLGAVEEFRILLLSCNVLGCDI